MRRHLLAASLWSRFIWTVCVLQDLDPELLSIPKSGVWDTRTHSYARPDSGSGGWSAAVCSVNRTGGKKPLCSDTQKVLYCIFLSFHVLMMATDHLSLYNKRTDLNDWNPKIMQTNKVKPNSGFLSLLFVSVLLCSVCLRLLDLGTKVRQSCPMQHSEFQFSCFCLDGGRLLGPLSAQMRVSWCQRLDGRMLSTFSMMKFRGANNVLRNCRDTKTWTGFKWAAL